MPHKTLRLAIAALAAVLIAAVVLNPSPDQHRATIEKVLAERSPLSRLLGLGSLTAFMSNYHTLGVLSYTVVDGKTVSFGAFGMVFVAQ